MMASKQTKKTGRRIARGRSSPSEQGPRCHAVGRGDTRWFGSSPLVAPATPCTHTRAVTPTIARASEVHLQSALRERLFDVRPVGEARAAA